jgi:outer membrane translocation and assembly module TamA
MIRFFWLLTTTPQRQKPKAKTEEDRSEQKLYKRCKPKLINLITEYGRIHSKNKAERGVTEKAIKIASLNIHIGLLDIFVSLALLYEFYR